MKDNLHCSFCGQSITNNNVVQSSKDEHIFICHSCVSQSKSLLDGKVTQSLHQNEQKKIDENILSPNEIYTFLNEYIIGQNEVKKTLSVAVYLHYRRLSYQLNRSSSKKDQTEDVEIDKSNILLIGPSGSGKTLLASTLARLLKVPFAIADATTLTEAGYVGDDVENILLRLIQNADHNISWAEKGIIFIDEIDKIGRKSENTSLTRDVSGEGVQQALLKIIEGTIASVPAQGGRKHPQSQNLQINTKNILFICGGAFIGIDDILKARKNQSTIGFKEEAEKIDEKEDFDIIPEDLVRFGLIPELVGRLPVISKLKELSQKEMRDILIKPKHSLLKQYQTLTQLDKKELVVEDSAIDYIIKQCAGYNTGARALRSIFDNLMLPILFDSPSRKEKKIILNKKNIDSNKYFYN